MKQVKLSESINEMLDLIASDRREREVINNQKQGVVAELIAKEYKRINEQTELQCEIDMLNAYIESEGLEEVGDWLVELAAKYTLHRLEASS